jgi:hypothetical protein
VPGVAVRCTVYNGHRTGAVDLLPAAAATGPADAWVGGGCGPAVHSDEGDGGGYVPILEHWDGHRWNLVRLPVGRADASISAIRAFGRNDIWAFGAARQDYDASMVGVAVHWDGRRWFVLPETANVVGFDTTANGRVWALRDTGSPSTTGSPSATGRAHFQLAQWNGGQWRSEGMPSGFTPTMPVRAGSPVDDDTSFGDLAAASDGGVWLGGDVGGAPSLAHFAGDGWTIDRVPARGIANPVLDNFGIYAGQSVWVELDAVPNPSPGADGPSSPTPARLTLWNGRTWTTRPDLENTATGAVAAGGHFWAPLDEGRLEEWTGSRWISGDASPVTFTTAVTAIPGTSSLLVVGYDNGENPAAPDPDDHGGPPVTALFTPRVAPRTG